MIGAELIAELDESSYNLNTSPYTVNLQGDLYDYHFFMFCDSASTTDGDVDITLNADTGSNYNRYYMRGATSTASASVSTSQANIDIKSFTRNASSRNSLGIGQLTGSSGNARKISVQHSSGNSPQVYQTDGYWTNTADEVTSMTFTGTTNAAYKWHICVYRVPKISAQGSWELMKELSWSSETAKKSFSSLDGDSHIQYMIQWDGDKNQNIRLNDDSGNNYNRQSIYNNSGTIEATNTTSEIALNTSAFQTKIIINAESGVDRLIYSSGSKAAAFQQDKRASWWQNTGSNLTSLDLTPAASATGKAVLYRRKNPYTTADSLPFRTLKTIDVSGDFSAGETISSLTGDDYKLIKIEWLGANAGGASNIEVQFNSDTGTNYHSQRLIGTSSSTVAQEGTSLDSIFISRTDEVSNGVIYLYPRSGEYRPVLSRGAYNESVVRFQGDWWLNSADEITSIKIFADDTDSLSGQIRISVLR